MHNFLEIPEKECSRSVAECKDNLLKATGLELCPLCSLQECQRFGASPATQTILPLSNMEFEAAKIQSNLTPELFFPCL